MLGENLQKERNNDILNNYYKFDAKYFAEKYKISIQAIYSIASKLKCTRDYLWDEHGENIIKDYNNGISVKELKKKYNHDGNNIRKFLKKNNIHIRNKSEAGQVYDFDHDFFKIIDTEEKAYWLGFIYADGNVYLNEELSKSVFQVCLAQKDKKHVEKLKNSLKSEHKIYKDRGNYRFIINNIELCNDLMKLGVIPRKSLTCGFPTSDQVPDHLIRHFIRGYFDGDGSIFKIKNVWGFQFVGTKEFLEKINLIFDKMGIPNRNLVKEKRNKEGKIFYYTVGGIIKYKNKYKERRRPYFELIYNYLYKDATIYLDRKKKRFDSYAKRRNL